MSTSKKNIDETRQGPSKSSKIKAISVVGPMMIIGAMQLGPGSTVAGASAGAEMGYSAIWLVVGSTIFMLIYTDMGLRIGLAHPRSPLATISSYTGNPVRIVLGVAFFFMAIL